MHLDDGLCSPRIRLKARQLLGTVCVAGGADCPLVSRPVAEHVLAAVKADPTVAIQLVSDADEIPHFDAWDDKDYAQQSTEHVQNRKRDLDVLQRLGLVPGATRRARFLYELLFERIETLDGICAHDTAGWEGCPLAKSGAYESVRGKGLPAVVYSRSAEDMAGFRERSAEAIAVSARLYIRPHHLMCLACGYAGGKNPGPRPNDTLGEILARIRREPDVPITLVEGTCMACCCCDGFFPGNGRCVHSCGLVRDFKKDLDVLQKLGLMPGATMGARALYDLLFSRIASTREVCAYGNGELTAEEWKICGGPDGNPGYVETRATGIF